MITRSQNLQTELPPWSLSKYDHTADTLAGPLAGPAAACAAAGVDGAEDAAGDGVAKDGFTIKPVTRGKYLCGPVSGMKGQKP